MGMTAEKFGRGNGSRYTRLFLAYKNKRHDEKINRDLSETKRFTEYARREMRKIYKPHSAHTTIFLGSF